MLRRRNSLSKIRLLLAVFLLYLCIHFSPIPIRLSISLVSANRSISPSYTVRDPITITNDDELAAVANSGTGTAADPYILEGWNITTAGTHGIYIYGTTKHFIIKNNCIDTNYTWPTYTDGIRVTNVAPGTATIVNNTVQNNDMGIRVENADYVTIANNTSQNSEQYVSKRNEYGIYLRYADYAAIINNTCRNNEKGGIGTFYSNNSIIRNNTCQTSYKGIVFGFDSHSLIITNNTCTDNTIGIRTIWSGKGQNNTITWNLLANNQNYGVSLDTDSSDNQIHHNSFFSNNYGSTQGYDNGSNNLWYDATVLEGNFWSDWIGPDEDDNGIVDHPYPIEGDASNSDIYPLVTPNTFTIYNRHLSPFTVLLPIGGDVLFGTVTIQWTSTVDILNHEVTYTISYSADNGRLWVTLVSDLTNLSYIWDSTIATDGSHCLIQVTAMCAEGAWRVATSGVFILDNVPPLTSFSSYMSDSSVNPEPPLDNLPVLQLLSSVVILAFVGTLVVVIRRQQMG